MAVVDEFGGGKVISSGNLRSSPSSLLFSSPLLNYLSLASCHSISSIKVICCLTAVLIPDLLKYLSFLLTSLRKNWKILTIMIRKAFTITYSPTLQPSTSNAIVQEFTDIRTASSPLPSLPLRFLHLCEIVDTRYIQVNSQLIYRRSRRSYCKPKAILNQINPGLLLYISHSFAQPKHPLARVPAALIRSLIKSVTETQVSSSVRINPLHWLCI